MHALDHEQLRPELQLLLKLARREVDESAAEACRQIIETHGAGFDWGFFIDQAGRHRLLPLIGKNIKVHRLDHSTNKLAAMPYSWVYPSLYAANSARNAGLAAEFHNVISAVHESGLEFAIRKGPVIGERLYKDPGVRRMSDLDILVERSNATALGQVLVGLGYMQGRMAADGTIQPFSRHAQIFWKSNVKNELPYVKLSTDNDFIEAYEVDICTDIFQTHSGSSVSTEDLLGRRVPLDVCGALGASLDPIDQFIDLCAHLHKEAITLYYLENGTDLEIMKFLDIALSAAETTQADRWTHVLARATQYNAVQSVYYALFYAAMLYPGLITRENLEPFTPEDSKYLDEYGGLDGRPTAWKQSFADRLFDTQRAGRVEIRSNVPRN